MKNRLMALVEQGSMKKEPLKFEVGDVVAVHQQILEGQKTRIQVFEGTVIARRGEGMREMFTVRRIVQGEGVRSYRYSIDLSLTLILSLLDMSGWESAAAQGGRVVVWFAGAGRRRYGSPVP